MRPLNFAIYFFVVICACTHKREVTYITDLAQQNIKGRVSRIETIVFLVDSNGQITTTESKTIENFNEEGFTTNDSITNTITHTTTANLFTFNDDGSMAGVISRQDGQLQSKQELEYDKAGKCVMFRSYDPAGRVDFYFTDIVQNKYGLIVSLNQYDSNNIKTASYRNSYDEIYQTSGTIMDTAGRKTAVTEIKLTDRKDPAQITTEITITRRMAETSITFYEYGGWDKAGNWTSQTWLNAARKKIKQVKRSIQYR